MTIAVLKKKMCMVKNILLILKQKNMKKFVFLFFYFLMVLNIHSQTNWSSFVAYHARNINDVFINDYNNICLVGGNKFNDSICSIFLSKDAGQTWQYIMDNISPWAKSITFTSSLNGYIVGDHGKILKTTDGGEHWTAYAIDLQLRSYDFSSVFFINSNIGFIVGGSTLIQHKIILKTTDAGHNWNIIFDELGKPFEASYFISELEGLVVGQEGDVYKTTDGGINWVKVQLPTQVSTRNFKSLYFIDNNVGIIVGGNFSNDSIQTIIKTTNGGDSWQIIKDELAPMLNDVCFINSNVAYAVGNNGVVLKTIDGGNNWSDVQLPNNTTSNSFNAVQFFNLDYGFIVGKYGVVYKFYNPIGQTPSSQTLAATDFNIDSITLNAKINPNGYATQLIFEYGFDQNYGQTIVPYPSVLNGNFDVNIQAKLHLLQPNMMYHYRVKATNAMGTVYGQDRQFYTGNPIPNFSFENWDSISFEFPLFYEFITSSVSKTTDAFTGNYAIQLINDSVNNEPGVLLMGNSNDGVNFTGGVPFSSKPDSIQLQMKYSIHQNDTATILLILKKMGSVISRNVYKITGTTNNQFQKNIFPIEYLSSESPDTVVFGIVSANIDQLSSLFYDNVIIVDNIEFTGTTDSIPNFDFEFWTTIQYPQLQSWDYQNKDFHKLSSNFFQSVNVLPSQVYHHGKYSVELKNVLLSDDSLPARITTKKFPVFHKPYSLTGFCYPMNNLLDTFNIYISLYRNDTVIANGCYKTTMNSITFEPFEIPITYNYELVPDSAMITISTCSLIPTSESVVLVDDLNFDSFMIFEKPDKFDNKITIFPNPASDNVHIMMSDENFDLINLKLYDVLGEIKMQKKIICNNVVNEIIFSVVDLMNGVFFIELEYNNKMMISKLVVKK